MNPGRDVPLMSGGLLGLPLLAELHFPCIFYDSCGAEAFVIFAFRDSACSLNDVAMLFPAMSRQWWQETEGYDTHMVGILARGIPEGTLAEATKM
eukprot:2694435-Amphidinium_carterae.1